MHIVISGGSGFLGKRLQMYLINNGHQVTILTRSLDGHQKLEGVKMVEWMNKGNHPEAELKGVDAIIHLASESISGSRWTKAKKERILSSRLNTTKEIYRIIANLEKKPQVLINASAVGYYGMSETETYTEYSRSDANDFLASVVKEWEREAGKVKELNVRTVFTRFGVILGDGGALPLMVLPYKLGVGGTMGNGKQWISWVHVDDAVQMIAYAITHPNINGPMNITAPNPVRMKEFGQTISKVLSRPHWLPVPSVAMKLGLGEMSDMILKGQRVLPELARKHGYTFQYSNLNDALENILGK
ncbi:multidrug MFS transporter [Heyndrickxia shackletonii]|uniref:Multidrug MFS transporter n=2 Tax=Heyndrickxia shackletonii TaxID=157838 RepID=A0A0Q3WUH2_9BACI|nr:TIGR01777 family oxidoreductase [Heyndrickxia shackletonii]KQL52356.1 multidrug MFS transporter [Heyndrickxia shackletonii]NEY99087.1 TIGR01777 family protein [Heyndrickxia shackletonii]